MKKCVFLSVLKSIASILILFAVLQPQVSFNKIGTKKNIVTIIVDNSASMQQFNADTLLSLIKDITESFSSDYLTLQTILFGDSSVLHSGIITPEYLDVHSNLNTEKMPFFADNETILFLTDGKIDTDLEDLKNRCAKKTFYLPLNSLQMKHHLSAEIDYHASMVVQKKRDSLRCFIHGKLEHSQTLSIILKKGTKSISKISMNEPAGTIEKSVVIPLPTTIAGINKYYLEIVNDTDSTFFSANIRQQVVKESLKFMQYGSAGNLDKRFFSLLLRKNMQWTEIFENDKLIPDVIILYKMDKKSHQLIKMFPTTAIVTVGASSRNDIKAIAVNNEAKLIPIINPYISSDHNFISNLPLPTLFYAENRHIGKFIDTLILLQDSVTNRSWPIVFRTLTKERPILHVAIEGVWHWLFQTASESADLTEKITSFFREAIITTYQYASLKDIYVYPTNDITYSGEALSLSLQIPVRMHGIVADSITYLFINTQSKQKYIFKNNKQFLFPSIINKTSHLQTGQYLYTVTLHTKNDRKVFSDTVTISKNNLEKCVKSQNKLFLDEIAQQLPSDSISLASFFTKVASRRDSQLKRLTVKVMRNPALLIMLLLLLCTEWVLRKIWNFD